MPEFADTHAHTAFQAFDADRAEVYDRARAAGFSFVIEIGVGLEGARRAVALAREHDILRPAGGLHPTGLETFEEDWPAYEELARSGALVAIGECGLDYHWMSSPKEVQEEAFRRQLRLARELELPFVVHCREAEEDVISVLQSEGYARGVVHCFSGTREQAEWLLAIGLHLSFCGNVTYPKNAALRETAAAVPLDRLLLETDCPFLAPQEKRGKRNEPAFAVHTAQFLAALHGVPLEEVAARTTGNARRLFALA